MPDTKQGRDRKARDEERLQREWEIERELAELEDERTPDDGEASDS
jgi:hypothetical protein